MPSSYDQLIQDYVLFRDDPAARIPESTTIAALLYELAGAGTGGSGSTATSDATEARQVELIAKNELIRLLLEDIKAATEALAPDNATRILTPRVWEEVNATTSPVTFDVAPDAWSVSFWLIQGDCSVNGYDLRLDNSFGFPLVPGSKYPIFNLELGANSIIQIVEVRD